jgi:hypothetical protein
MKQGGDGRTEDIGVEKAHTVAGTCQTDGEISGYGRFTYASLAAGYGYDVADLGQEFLRCLGLVLRCQSRDFSFHLLSAMGLDGGLGCLHDRFHEGVGIVGYRVFR